MTVPRVSMHNIKEVLRLKYATGLKQRQIAAALGLSNGVVAKYLSAAERAQLSYPLPVDWDDTDLAHALFGSSHQSAPVKRLTLDGCARSSRTKTQRRHPPTLVGRVSRLAPGGLRRARSFVCSIASGVKHSDFRCAKFTMPVKNSSSITAGKAFRSSTPPPAKSKSHRSSSPLSAPPTTHLPKPPGRKICPTGSARIRAPLPSSAAHRNWSFPTTSKVLSVKPAATNHYSTLPTTRCSRYSRMRGAAGAPLYAER